MAVRCWLVYTFLDPWISIPFQVLYTLTDPRIPDDPEERERRRSMEDHARSDGTTAFPESKSKTTTPGRARC